VAEHHHPTTTTKQLRGSILKLKAVRRHNQSSISYNENFLTSETVHSAGMDIDIVVEFSKLWFWSRGLPSDLRP
jgi:hypothetical protein